MSVLIDEPAPKKRGGGKRKSEGGGGGGWSSKDGSKKRKVSGGKEVSQKSIRWSWSVGSERQSRSRC